MTMPLGGNAVNLAALAVPILPETSHLREQMRGIGTQMRRDMLEGFNSGGDLESVGNSFGSRVMAGFSKQMGQANFGFITNAVEKMGEQFDAKLAAKLKGELPQSYRVASEAAQQFHQSQTKVVEVQERVAAAHQKVAAAQADLAAREQKSQEVVRITNELNAQGVTYTEALAEAHRRTGTTEGDLITSRRNLTTATREVENATRQQRTVEEETTTARQKAGEATQQHTEKMNQFQAASAKAATSGALLGSLLGTALVGGFNLLTGAVEGFIHLGEHIFEEAIHGAEELANKLVEIGEDYASLNVQTVEFSGATGGALTDMQEHVARVFSQLDVAGKNLGQTYAQLHSMLGLEPGPELDELARKVTDLQGRFSNLKAQDLGAIFRDFNVQDANAALDTLVDNAARAGEGLGDVASDLKGKVGETLAQANISLGNATWFLGELHKMGIPATDVVTGLATAMGKLKEQGMDFPTAMREVVKQLLNATEAQKANAEATLFGGRRWTEVAPALELLNEALNGNADAHDGAKGAADRQIDSTELLNNKIEKLKHQIEGMLAPFGEEFLSGIEHALERVRNWFDRNHAQVIAKLQEWGNKFIDMLPTIKEWAADFVEVMGVAAAAMTVPVAQMMELAGATLIVGGHFKDGVDLIKDAGKLMLSGPNIIDQTDKWADKLKNLKLPLSDLHHGLDEAAQSAQDLADREADLDRLNDSLGDSFGRMAPSSFMMPSSPGGGGFPGGGGGGAPGGGPRIIGAGMTFGGGDKASAAKLIYNAVVGSGYSPTTALYAVADSLYESGLSSDVTNASGHHGLFQESSDKPSAGPLQQIQWFLSALAAAGGPGVVDADPANAIADRVEIGGYSGSAYDSKLGEARSLLGFDQGGSVPGMDAATTNSRGGWSDYAGQSGWTGSGVRPFDPSNDPEMVTGRTSFNSGLRLDLSTSGMGSGWNSLNPFQKGWNLFASGAEGLFDSSSSPIDNSIAGWFAGHHAFATGGPGPKDTIPAMVAPGEYVWNEAATSKFGWFIDLANRAALGGNTGWFTSSPTGQGLLTGLLGSLGMDIGGGKKKGVKGFQGGGLGSGSANAYAGNPGYDDDQGSTPEILGAEQLAHGFGLRLTAGHSGKHHEYDGGYHDSGEAGDFSNGQGTAEEVAFAAYMVENFGGQLAELIHYDPEHGWDGSYNIKDGKTIAEYGGPPKVYDMGTLSGHNDHVHVAFKPGMAPQLAAFGAGGGGGGGFGGGFGGGGAGFFGADFHGGGGGGGGGRGGGGGGMPSPFVGGGPGGMFNPRTGLPGLPGQYGGFGQYGGETLDQQIMKNRAVQDAQERVKDLEKRRDKIQNEEIPKVQQQLDAERAKIPAMQDQAKITNLENEIKDRKDELDKINNRDLPRAREDIGMAEHRRDEASMKSPAGLKGSERTPKFSAAQQFGSGLLSGIAESLGLPDVFGKPPWEFGAFKMLSKALGIGFSWMNELGSMEGFGNAAGNEGIPGMDEATGGGGPGGGIPGLNNLLNGAHSGQFGPKTVDHAPQAGGGGGGPGVQVQIPLTLPRNPEGNMKPSWRSPEGAVVGAAYHHHEGDVNIYGVPHPDVVRGLADYRNSHEANQLRVNSPAALHMAN